MNKDLTVEILFQIPSVVLNADDFKSVEALKAAVVKRIGRPAQKLIERYNAEILLEPAERIGEHYGEE